MKKWRLAKEGNEAAGLRPEIARAIEYIEAHYREPIRLEEVAEVASLSPFHFSRVFRAEVGVTFQRYLGGVRTERAKDLLLERPRMTVARVAREAGFRSMSAFYHHFRRLVGCTPSEYRAQHGKHA